MSTIAEIEQLADILRPGFGGEPQAETLERLVGIALEAQSSAMRLTTEATDQRLLLDAARRDVRELEAELVAVKDGALDTMELARGLQGHALLEAIRVVRRRLTSAGADPQASTVAMAKWAADRLALGYGPSPEVNVMAQGAIMMAIKPLYPVAEALSPEGRRGLAHAMAAAARRFVGL